jgi:hypothetical protein
MGGKKKRNRYAGRQALANQEGILADQAAAQELYDADLSALRDASQVTDFYENLNFSSIDPDSMRKAELDEMKLGTLGAQRVANVEGYDAAQTNVAGLARGADTGLSNVFNNLQVSTAGAELEAQEADQALAASQDMMMQMGGGGGATALAQQAARSKAGIRASIDQQVKANEMMRAQGEQSLQRDLLAQGNLASQFDLGQAQFNVGQDNRARQFSAQARNQAEMFNAGQANQMNLTKFGAENRMNQFNAAAANNAFANQANAINQSIAKNAEMQNQFNLAQAGGRLTTQSSQYDALMGIQEISQAQLNDADRRAGENQATIDVARMSGMNKDGSYTKKWYEKLGNTVGKAALIGTGAAFGGIGGALIANEALKKG